jgi:D-amino-acid dehydrogenase
MTDAVRFAGTLELAGLDLSIDQRRVRAILRAVPEYVPDLDPARLELVEIWRGLRPCTPDGLPLLGRTRTPSNLTVAAGHATIGVSLGPVTGKLVSQVVSESETGFDLNALAVERFG